MGITAKEVNELIQMTGAGMMDCKTALQETDGDLEKAVDVLRKKGIAKAEKKASREVRDGLVEAYIHAGGKLGVLVEINCETDFVAKTDDFTNLAKEIAMQVNSMNPKNEKELLDQEYNRDPSVTIGELIKQASGKLGENIQLKRFTRYELGKK